MSTIRYFGDKILFSPTHRVDFQSTENIAEAIEIMMASLRQYSGVGIAANQCEGIPPPVPSIIIVGVLDEESRRKAQTRYPDIQIPDATVLINPSIIDRSIETYFPKMGEGCLSVPCSFRGKVRRHRWVTVQYQNQEGQTFQKKLTDISAHIVQHEIDHMSGLVFMHHIIEEMSVAQRSAFASIIDEILAHPHPAEDILKVPTLVVDRDEEGNVLVNQENLKATLSALDPPVLRALKAAAFRS